MRKLILVLVLMLRVSWGEGSYAKTGFVVGTFGSGNWARFVVRTDNAIFEFPYVMYITHSEWVDEKAVK